MSRAPTLEWTSSGISCWLGVFGTRARWLFKKSCLWDKNKLQAARENFWELFVIFWTRSSTDRVTQSGPKSRSLSKPSSEIEITMLLYCRLKVYKMTMEMNFPLTVSTVWLSTRLCVNWTDFCFLWHRFGCA